MFMFSENWKSLKTLKTFSWTNIKKLELVFLPPRKVKDLFEWFSLQWLWQLWIQLIQWIMTQIHMEWLIVCIQRYYSSGNRYILPVLVIQSVFSLLPLGRYLLQVTTQTRYQPTDSRWKITVSLPYQGMYLLSDIEISSNHTVLGFGHDSLN